jgi:hypothetical protein
VPQPSVASCCGAAFHCKEQWFRIVVSSCNAAIVLNVRTNILLQRNIIFTSRTMRNNATPVAWVSAADASKDLAASALPRSGLPTRRRAAASAGGSTLRRGRPSWPPCRGRPQGAPQGRPYEERTCKQQPNNNNPGYRSRAKCSGIGISCRGAIREFQFPEYTDLRMWSSGAA